MGSTLINLGMTMLELELLGRARQQFQRALELYRDDARFGPRSAEAATCLNNLGAVARANGDVKQTMQNFQEALSIEREVFGAEHPRVANRIANVLLGSRLA